jgi:DNA mismatch endonuclease, patch repair protein
MEKMSRESRSRIMRGVRSKDTQPEMRIRQALHAAGFRYRLHVRGLPGTPDLVFPKYRSIIEVRGCFWHWHSCIGGRVPATNAEFWLRKLSRNKIRDQANVKQLRALGYRVKVVWECELQPRTFDRTIVRLIAWLQAAHSSHA